MSLYTWRLDNKYPTHNACRVCVDVFGNLDEDTLDRIGHMIFRLRHKGEQGFAMVWEKGIYVGNVVSRTDGRNLFFRQSSSDVTVLFLKRKYGE